MQMAHHLGGQVRYTGRREYGAGILDVTNGSQLFDGLGQQVDVWNSHGDEVTALPAGFRVAAHTSSSPFAAVEDPQRKLYGLQFHPEVAHTPRGREILQNFITNALKYTEKGKITLSAEVAEGGIRFLVSDTGIGISKTDQEKIFDKLSDSDGLQCKEHKEQKHFFAISAFFCG